MSTEPAAWKKLGESIHQDFMLDYPDFWSGIDQFAKDITKEEREELIMFLTPLVENEQPGGSLKRIWENTGSEIIITRIKPKELFTELLNRFSSTELNSSANVENT